MPRSEIPLPSTPGPSLPALQEERDRIAGIAERMIGSTHRAALRGVVHELMSFLPAHFHREEAPGGPLATALAEDPGQAWHVEAIQDRHALILEGLEELWSNLDGDALTEDERAEATRIGRLLQDHEARELRLLERRPPTQ